MNCEAVAQPEGYLHSGCSTIADPSGKAMIIGKFGIPDLVIYDIGETP